MRIAMRPVLSTAIAAGMVAGFVGSAVAQAAKTLTTADVARHEFRTTIWDGSKAQYHLWVFAADGTVSGIYMATAGMSRLSRTFERYDSGSWSVETGALCVKWREWFGRTRNCYRVIPLKGRWVRAVNTGTGPSLRGTLAPVAGR